MYNIVRSFYFFSIAIILLFAQLSFAQPFQSGNILVTSDNRLIEVTPTGFVVQDIPIPPSADTYPAARDLIVNGEGNVAIYNGTAYPELSVFDPNVESWAGFPQFNWSTANNISYGGIAAYGNDVYVTDMYTGVDTPVDNNGIIQILPDGTGIRHLIGQDYIDLTLGLDGLFYALRDLYGKLDVIDPVTMTVINSHSLGHSDGIRGVAVNSFGEIYAVTWSGFLNKYDPSGLLLNSIDTGAGSLWDIDINASGTIIFQARIGNVYITDETFVPPQPVFLPVPSYSNTFVAFVNVGSSGGGTSTDSDGDGMPDDWEMANGLNPYDSGDAFLDNDFDGLTNLEEFQANSDPNAEDTDQDGLFDGDEVMMGTDPSNPDTDGDGMTDGWEYYFWLDPNNPDDASFDNDFDGLTNAEEFSAGTIPDNPDSDNDGITDGDEVSAGLNPLNPDSDGDSMWDGWEQSFGLNPLDAGDAALDNDNDGLTNENEYSYNTDPNNADSDSDNLTDGDEVQVYQTDPSDPDSDNDTIDDGQEVTNYGTNPNSADSDNDTLSDADEIFVHSTNPLSNDSDGDTMTDGWEISYSLNPLVASDAQEDLDLDSFTNLEEFLAETRPNDASHYPGGPSTLKWSFATGAAITSAPVIGPDGSIYFSSRDYHVYALNADGTLKWSVNIGGWGSSTTIGTDGTVYVGTYTRKLYAIATDGTIKWSFDTVGAVYATPVLDTDGTIYVGSYRPSSSGTTASRFYAINPDGTLKWEQMLGSDIRYAAAVARDGTIYVGTNNGDLHVYNNDGTMRFGVIVTPGFWLRPPAIAEDGNVYVQSTNNGLYKISPTGQRTLIRSIGPVILSSPVIGTDGTIYTGGYNNELIAINPDGSEQWATSISNIARVNTTPAIGADGTIYVGSQDGKLHAVNADGALKWNYQAGNRISSHPAIGKDGTIYVGSEDGSMYAINGTSGGLAASAWPSFSHDSYHTGNVLTGTPLIESAVVNNARSDSWTTVTLPKSYYSMVISATPVYDGTSPPMVTRIQNVTNNSFDIRVDRADGQSGAVTGISIHYMAVEEGNYNAASHGITMEAHKFLSTVTDNVSSWNAERQTLNNNYASPVVLGQVMSYNDPRFSVFWSRGSNKKNPATTDDIRVGKHVAEDPDNQRLPETVGYITIESGSGVVDGYSYVANRGPDTIKGMQNGIFQYNYSGLSAPTSVVASQTGMDGGNGGWAVLTGATPLTSTTVSLAIDEDLIKDNERSHAAEQVDYIVFERTN